MELSEVVERYARAFEFVDMSTVTQNVNRRTGELYPLSFKSLYEQQVVNEADAAWADLYEGDFSNPSQPRVQVPYPGLPRTTCDHVFTTDNNSDPPEWAVELKNVALVGNNGANNDFAVAKMLSPFLKDRSVLHDAARLRQYELARRHAVVGYAFNYDESTCQEALERHPAGKPLVARIRDLCVKNGGFMTIRPLLEFAEAILLMRGVVRGPRVEAHFKAWRHPCGGEGLVFGWEIRRHELEPEYDPRHPW